MATKQAEPDINKYRLVFLDDEDFVSFKTAMGKGAFAHGKLSEKGYTNFSTKDGSAIYLMAKDRKSLIGKAEKGNPL